MNAETAELMTRLQRALSFPNAYANWETVMKLQTAAFQDGLERGKVETLDRIRKEGYGWIKDGYVYAIRSHKFDNFLGG